MCYKIILNSSSSINWQAVSSLIAAIAIVGTVIGLITTWVKIFCDNKYKRSQFYLEQIKNYLKNAISILVENNNNNIKWHQAIASLKVADDLKNKLSDESHRHIYFLDYLNTAYEVVNIIEKINDFRFFYGIPDYKDCTPEILYERSNPRKLDEKCLRIDPEELKYLCAFFDKVNKADFDVHHHKSSWEKVFDKDYFKKNIDENGEISQFTKLSLNVIFKYIENFQEQQKISLEQ